MKKAIKDFSVTDETHRKRRLTHKLGRNTFYWKVETRVLHVAHAGSANKLLLLPWEK
jgi:hypothetical protein